MANAFDLGLLLVLAVVFAAGVLRKLIYLSVGAKEGRIDRPSDRLNSVLSDVLLHKRVRKDKPHGTHHLLLFYAFILPVAVVLLVQVGFRMWTPLAWLTTLVLEVVAALGLYGTTRLMLRRYTKRPEELDEKLEDSWIYPLLYGIFITGFLTEAARLAATPSLAGMFAPIGFALSLPFHMLSDSGQAVAVAFLWRFHLLLVLVTVALTPWGKLSHAIFGPLNIFFTNRGPKGAFSLMDLENSEVFGAGEIQCFSRKQLLDLEACVRCGRCQKNCPAFNTGKTLNPKKVVQDLKSHMLAKVPKMLMGKGEQFETPMIDGDGVTQEDLWSCTTCRHCMEVCPVRVEHVDKVVDMRRHMVLMEGQMPDELITVNKNLENNYNPWGVGWSERNDWMRRRDVSPRILTEEENPQFDVLLWVGCAGSFDDRYQRVAAAMCRILDRAGVNYGVLGEAEKCCGDPARATGNEYLYQMLASENIETMNSLGVKKIVTTCPHCLKVLDKEYPQLGGDYEVVHHGQYLLDLVAKHRLHLSRDLPQSVTLHDSCYLSRYAGQVDEPRGLLTSVGGLELREMERSREDNFCCGAGGGRMFMEEEGERINNNRTAEALETGADTICSACPFCLTMLSDGVKAAKMEEDKEVLDIAEIIERALA